MPKIIWKKISFNVLSWLNLAFSIFREVNTSFTDTHSHLSLMTKNRTTEGNKYLLGHFTAFCLH